MYIQSVCQRLDFLHDKYICIAIHRIDRKHFPSFWFCCWPIFCLSQFYTKKNFPFIRKDTIKWRSYRMWNSITFIPFSIRCALTHGQISSLHLFSHIERECKTIFCGIFAYRSIESAQCFVLILSYVYLCFVFCVLWHEGT